MAGFFPEFDFSRVGLVRENILSAILKVLGTVALTMGWAVLAHSQTPPLSPKLSRSARALPLTEFYSTPNPLPEDKPGELIRFEQSDDYHLAYGISAFRILYHSRSATGKDVAVSGVVLVPDRPVPAGGWSVIAWAHEFIGSARQCAPSLVKNLDEGPLLSMYADLGYAVVASDYAGLGTSFPHAALDVRSNATDVVYSIPAARAALPQLGPKWVVAGYLQGSSVAIGVAEAEGELGDPNYLGAIAISGVAQPQEVFQHLAQGPADLMLVFLAQGIRTTFPKFRVEEMLTDKAMPLYQQISLSCEARLGSEHTGKEMLKPGWEKNPYIEQFFTRNTLGQRPIGSPMLVITGESDRNVPLTLTTATVARLCEEKDRVLFIKNSGSDGSAVLRNSMSEQISWIRARFAGHPAPSNCP
jgi:pimeloyl-ACP methyl ester carboxylesterase